MGRKVRHNRANSPTVRRPLTGSNLRILIAIRYTPGFPRWQASGHMVYPQIGMNLKYAILVSALAAAGAVCLGFLVSAQQSPPPPATKAPQSTPDLQDLPDAPTATSQAM